MIAGLRRIAWVLTLSAPSCVATPAHADVAFPNRGRAAVVDAANVIPADDERLLNDRIVAWAKAYRHQLVVATVPSLGGIDIKDYGYRLGRSWGLGDASENDGVILLLAPNERKVRVEVGYGLEPILTDALTSEIIRDTIVPRLRADDVAGALGKGADAIMIAATPEPVQPLTVVDRPARQYPSAWWLLIIPPALILLIGCLRVYRRRRDDWREAEAAAARARDAAAREKRRDRRDRERPLRAADASDDQVVEIEPQDGYRQWRPVSAAPILYPASIAPVIAPPPYVTPRREEPYVSPAPSYSPPPPSSSSTDWGSSSSSDSSSSSSGFDSGGGSFGGGGSDSGY